MNSIKKIVSEDFKFWEVIILMGLTAVVGITLGGFIIKKNYGLDKTGTFTPALQDFVNNYNYIANNYYGEIDEDELLKKALETILEEIDDPYAAYLDENESNNLNIQLSGSYRGMGIEVGTLTTGQLMITGVFSASPAEKAGLQSGDIILSLNDESIQGISGSEFANKIKELSGSFMLTVLRNETEEEFNIRLDTVVIKSVESKMVEKNIGYVYISIFADNTYEQLQAALDSLNNAGMQSLIIDLRENTGGYLTSVEKILGLFLDNSHVIYQIQDKSGITKYYSKGKTTVTYPIVILTNSATASASEIMTAALKEELGAISVGKKTYGKGSAQKLHTLDNGSKYKFTTQKWLTPLGLSIDKVGIDVNYDIDMDKAYYDEPIIENDNQLQYAIKLLKMNN